MPQATLHRALHFSDDDILANRNGSLSPTQKRRLRRRIFWLNSVYCSGGLFFFVAALYMEPWAVGLADGRLWTAIVIVLMAIFGVQHLWGESADFKHDVNVGKVQRIAGSVRCQFSEWGRGIQAGGEFYIQIHDQRFFVPWSAYEAFEDHKKYVIYYLPTVKRVVAAEPSRWG